MSARLPTLRLAALAVVLAAAAPAVAQRGGDGLRLHHTAPVAGRTLTLVIEGAEPGEPVIVYVTDATRAPSSLVALMIEIGGPWEREPVPYPALAASTPASPGGLVVLSFPLDDPDPLRAVSVIAAQGGSESELLELEVQPPTALVPVEGGLARIDLRDGAPLRPWIDGDPVLLGAALSASGREALLLRDGGRLEQRDTTTWQALLRDVRLPDSVDVLANEGTGPLVALARPLGRPYAAPGRLLVLDAAEPEVVGEVVLESLAAPVDGRRVALDPQGSVAFVAEDELLVREVDLVAGERRLPFTAGAAGDRQIADMVLVGRHLFVLTRRADGLPGTLTVLDRDRGVDVLTLPFDPARLVRVDEERGRVLVVPAGGPRALLVGPRLGTRPLGPPAAGASWRDAAVLGDGRVAVLASGAGGAGTASLHLLDPAGGWTGEVHALAASPERVLTAGGEAALLLGDPAGAVLAYDGAARIVRTLPGVRARPDLPFAVLR